MEKIETDNLLKKAFKILSCDDEHQIKEFLWNLLNEEGHIVDFAKNGEEVFQRLGKTKYDLVILDVNIPKMNGYKVSEKICKTIKNRPKILIFTGRDIEAEKLQFAYSDADAILQKGTPIDTIIKTIHKLLMEQTSPIKAKSHARSVLNSTFLSASTDINFVPKQNTNSQLNRIQDFNYCMEKISKVEKLITDKIKAYEEFIKYALTEKQNAEKKFSELKKLETGLKNAQMWLYILFVLFLIAIFVSFL
ncbi:MAG: response regulator [Elusimicrobia bacterium]|nr:response regulator [Elusimicrobiota bacterium]